MPMKRLLAVLAGIGLLLGLVLALRPQTVERAAASEPAVASSVADAAAPVPDGAGRSPRPTEDSPQRLSIIAVGDIMTDRNVGRAIASRGAESILAKVRDVTADADISVANLENPLSTAGPHDAPACVFRALPETVKVLLDGGFDVVSLANNHTLNAGREGVLQTLNVLEKNSIQYCGAWRDKSKIGEPTYATAGEGPVRLGFIGITDLSFGHGSYNKVSADRSNLAAQIKQAKQHCDLVVVSVHWGDEYKPLPNQRQRNTAHAAIDADADLVLGHHPHTLEGIEAYKGKPILYSMGNFVFDQREGERMESAIFRLDYACGWGWQIMAKPVWIPHSRLGPIFPEPARRDKILARLVKISKPLGTNLQIKDGKAWLRIPQPAA
jgi:poly-gamma-glutamate synthesis protein (capsule biosynthesis protein)